MATTKLPLNDLARHTSAMEAELREAVGRVISRGWYLLGSETEAFERAFAHFCGVQHCIGVANGTDALELTMRAVGVRPGDRVITTANAGFYVATALVAIGATPAYSDVAPDSHLMTAELLAQALKRGPARAVVVTHLYGRLADVGGIARICVDAGIPMIEDCAQAHGAARGGGRAGSFGLAGCFSFYPTKNLGALGDGGAVVSDNGAFVERVRTLRQYGWKEKYRVSLLGGCNSRLDEIQAAALMAKLPKLEGLNARRRAIAKRYDEEIDHPDVICPGGGGEDFVAHLYVIRCKARGSLRAHLDRLGIASDIHFPVPDHKQVALQELGPWPALPVTEQLADEIVTLPCFPEMTDGEVSRVAAAVNSWQS